MEDFINQLSHTIGISPFMMTMLTGILCGFILGKAKGGVTAPLRSIEKEMNSKSSMRKIFDTSLSSTPSHTSLTVNNTSIEIEPSLMEKVFLLLNKKNKIEAIKILREEKGLDLKTAKCMVDFIEMRATSLDIK